MSKWKLVFFISLFSQQAFSQPIENIVFEGAGIRGIAYGGVIQALEENNQIKTLKRIGGTSAGAISAALLAVGYNASEINHIIGSTNFAKFNDGGMPFFGGMFRMPKKFGWFKGEKFEQWLGKLIEAKTGNANIDFKTIAQQYKELYITGTCLNKQQTIIFNHNTYPNMPIKTAVRISMSVPMYFSAVLMDDEGKIYKKMPKHKQLNVMVDGGLMLNFPIHIFDSTKYTTTKNENWPAYNNTTIGCRIDSKSQIAVDYSSNRGKSAELDIKNFSSYLRAFSILITEQLNRNQLTHADWLRTVSIEDANIGPKVKKMKKNQCNQLIKNGYDATILFLKNRNSIKPQ
jgi:NTE family protein